MRQKIKDFGVIALAFVKAVPTLAATAVFVGWLLMLFLGNLRAAGLVESAVSWFDSSFIVVSAGALVGSLRGITQSR